MLFFGRRKHETSVHHVQHDTKLKNRASKLHEKRMKTIRHHVEKDLAKRKRIISKRIKESEKIRDRRSEAL